MSEAAAILTYAAPAGASGAPRRCCHGAVMALVWVLACPVCIALPLVYAASRNWLPQHFLCCRHPEVTVLAFSGMPLIGAVWGGVAIGQILRDVGRPRPRGMVAASLAVVIGLGLAVMGVLLLSGLRV